MIEQMTEYFKKLGFDHLCYETRGEDPSIVYSDLRGAYVHLYPNSGEVEITTIDGMIHSTTSRLGFPNKNIPIFLEKIERHRPLSY